MKTKDKVHQELCSALEKHFKSQGAAVDRGIQLGGRGEVDLLITSQTSRPKIIEVKSFPASPNQGKVKRQMQLYQAEFPSSDYFLAFPQGISIALLDVTTQQKYLIGYSN